VTKNEFLNLVADEFLAAHGAWRRLYENRRAYSLAVGRQVGSTCLVFLDLDCRPNNYRFGHGVGWCPSHEYFQAWRQRRVNPPSYSRSGSLRRIRSLKDPLDFHNEEMRLETFQLHKPFADYDLESASPEEVKREMLGEMEDYALPYLLLMLRARHGLELTQAELSGASGVVT
jgi:hypothetical protein